MTKELAMAEEITNISHYDSMPGTDLTQLQCQKDTVFFNIIFPISFQFLVVV